MVRFSDQWMVQTKKTKKKKLTFFFLRISKEQNSKDRTKHAYIRTNSFFWSKSDLKERLTNFERTLFDLTTYPGFGKARSDHFYQHLLYILKEDLNYFIFQIMHKKQTFEIFNEKKTPKHRTHFIKINNYF
jgi:hypothetical protein